MKKWGLVALLFVVVSCEKNIDFNLKAADPLLTVDAQIENDQAPVVVLTKSFSYYQALTPQLLSNSFVHDAEVYMSNGTQTHRLREYSVPLAPGLSAFYYGIDSSSLATAFSGATGTTYSLRIVSEGKEYNASTNIPPQLYFPDSLWFRVAPQNPDTSKRVLYMRATDPAGRGNYNRYFTRKNSEPFYAGIVFNDQVTDGTTYTILLPQGFNRNNPPTEEENFFTRGDTVTVKFSAIDKATYSFWNTWEFAQQSIGNPFAQPNKVLGNISNGALGVFAGYGSAYQTLIAP